MNYSDKNMDDLIETIEMKTQETTWKKLGLQVWLIWQKTFVPVIGIFPEQGNDADEGDELCIWYSIGDCQYDCIPVSEAQLRINVK